MSKDSKDRVKIEERTQRYPAPYDYRLRIAGDPGPGAPFSFLVVGDSGAGGPEGRPKYDVASEMAQEPGIELTLHLGDVVYISGSKQGYVNRFIRVYRDWIVDPDRARHDRIVFRRPLLPVYGNHDYYDYHKMRVSVFGLNVAPLLAPLASAVGDVLEHELGTGSHNGRVFEEAFVNAGGGGLRDGALDYVPGSRTKVPNRYYWFTYGDCAFYALDSNTLDGGPPLEGEERRRTERRRERALEEVGPAKAAYERAREAAEGAPADDERARAALVGALDDLVDAQKRVDALENLLDQTAEDLDGAQLAWLDRALAHPDAAGKWRVVYMHHPFYSSDESHTGEPESDGLRRNLSRLFADHRVNLVLSGHSHCFEWVQRRRRDPLSPVFDEADAACHLISGGGGQRLRGSVLDEGEDGRFDGERLAERRSDRRRFVEQAESHAYTGVLPSAPPGGGAAVHHYLRVNVGGDRLEVVPVGVVDGRREHPMRTQAFGTGGPFGDVAGRLGRIANVVVRRGRRPEGTFVP